MAPRRVSASQLRSQIRQAQLKQRQAIDKYNAGDRKVNRWIDDYNRAARATTRCHPAGCSAPSGGALRLSDLPTILTILKP